MKIIRSIIQNQGILVAVMTIGGSYVVAQTVDSSSGTILDSTTSRTAIPPESPAPTRLTASVLPISKDTKTNGEMTFVVTGNSVGVTGRITGMEPNKRYQAVVWVPATLQVMNIPGNVVNPSSEARPPAAESPPTGSPAPATPTASPATTDTTVTTSGPQPVELDLGTMVSDARGTANLNSTISNKDLTPPPTGILGCSVVIKRAPPLNSPDERSPIAAGVIGVPELVVRVPVVP